MITIAHVSDVHLDGRSRAHERTEKVLGFLRSAGSQIDVVLVTGDIADRGRPQEYEEAKALLDLPLPVLLLPGNHDVRSAFADGLLGRGFPGDARQDPRTGPDDEINQLATVAGVDFLLCDSSIPGQDGGRLSDSTLDWLERTLTGRGGGAPALVCFHHPPVDLHLPHVDPIRQVGEERLAELVRRHPNVVAMLCGHAHTAAVSTFAGVPLCVAPGVSSTIRLPLEGMPAVDQQAPPAVAIHLLDDDRRLVTHFRPIC
jgi:Icc protein